jgi:hypothetical protein
MQMEDLAKRAVQHVFMASDSAHGSEADMAVRPHQHRTLPSDFPLRGPRAPCIDVVAFKYADPNGDPIEFSILPREGRETERTLLPNVR